MLSTLNFMALKILFLLDGENKKSGLFAGE
jgi:hypothetical protein